MTSRNKRKQRQINAEAQAAGRKAHRSGSLDQEAYQKVLNTALVTAKNSDLPTVIRGLPSNTGYNPLRSKVTAIVDHKDRASINKLLSLLQLLDRKAKNLCEVDHLQALWNLVKLPWRRHPDEWRPKGKSTQRRLTSLITHLVVEYPVPGFLYGVFATKEKSHIDLFCHLTEGGSMKVALKKKYITVPLTKKMCHLFMQSPLTVTVPEAVRFAQVQAFGGSKALAAALASNGLFRDLKPLIREVRLEEIIQWFCNQTMLDNTKVGPLSDYIRQIWNEQGGNFRMAGRSALALLRDMERWHRELQVANHSRRWNVPKFFDACGLRGKKWQIKVSGRNLPVEWEIKEILTQTALTAEGRTMKHCVASYGYSISTGNISIWSLRKDDYPEVTVEVDNKRRSIMQARGSCNRNPKPQATNLINQWAADNQLSFSGRW